MNGKDTCITRSTTLTLTQISNLSFPIDFQCKSTVFMLVFTDWDKNIYYFLWLWTAGFTQSCLLMFWFDWMNLIRSQRRAYLSVISRWLVKASSSSCQKNNMIHDNSIPQTNWECHRAKHFRKSLNRQKDKHLLRVDVQLLSQHPFLVLPLRLLIGW